MRAVFGCFLFAGGFACWAVALASMLLAAGSRRADVPRPSFFEGPFDVVYRPSLLTAEGRRHRKRFFLAAGGSGR
jgi:hypothetical protein